MSKVLIIGCGGVASVAIHKCCQVPEVFTEICIASRTKAKCDKLAAELAPKTTTKITTAQVDADKVEEVIALIKSYQPDLVMNIALPYQDLTIMDACLACGVNYMDTANYEPENTDDPEWRAIYEKRCKEAGFSAYFDYSWQWAYAKKFEEAGLTALLGSGFDPGVTQAYCAYAKKHEFDTIDTIDILDCNGGDHGYAFATNFNPEINLREVSAPGSYWENGHWVEIPAMSIKREYNFDQVGDKDMYLLHHEEIESLAKNIPEAKRIRFFMTFGQSYLDHMRCLEDVGMLSTTPVNFNGQEIVPIQFLKALLPDPASLGPRTKGKTNIGCIFTGKKDGKDKTYYIYNVCDHQECYREVGSQAIINTMLNGILIGNMGLATTLGVISMVPSIFFAAFGAKYVGKKGSKKGIVTWTCISMAITSVLILFFIFTDTRQIGVMGSWNMIVYVLLPLLQNGSNMCITTSNTSYMADTIDYELDRSGRYIPAVVSGTYSLIDKLITSVAAVIATGAVAILGYTTTMPQPTDPCPSAIFWMPLSLKFGLPLIGWVITLVAMRECPLTKEEMVNVQKRISDKKDALRHEVIAEHMQ